MYNVDDNKRKIRENKVFEKTKLKYSVSIEKWRNRHHFLSNVLSFLRKIIEQSDARSVKATLPSN